MTIRKQTLFQGWGDLPWLAMLVAGISAITAAGALLPDLPGLVALLGGGAGFLFITARRYVARETWLAGIAGYTSQGTAVWLDPEIPREAVRLVEAEIAMALSFWTRLYPTKTTALTDAFNGAVAGLHYADVLLAKFVGKAHGVSGPKSMATAWPAGRPWADVSGDARHEAGHVCLFAAGVPQEKHHEVMAAAGFR